MTQLFFDSNILIYALGDDTKAIVSRDLLDRGGQISVQSLNEFANVARKKLKYEWPVINELSKALRRRFSPIVPLTDDLHASAVAFAERHGFAFYDALIVTAALAVGCDTLCSEDMHTDLVIDGELTVVNPFA